MILFKFILFLRLFLFISLEILFLNFHFYYQGVEQKVIKYPLVFKPISLFNKGKFKKYFLKTR